MPGANPAGSPQRTPNPVLERITWWSWLALLLTIPVTSFPWIAAFSGGETPVSPLSLLPMAIVLLLGVVPGLLRGRSLPGLVWPLLLFVLLAVLSSALAIRLPLIPFKGTTPSARFVRTLLTLAIGLGFYLAAIFMTAQAWQQKSSLKALYAGLLALLIWSTVQGYFVLQGVERLPLVVTKIQHVFSVRDPLPDRVVGMAFEPSWLGDQLVVLYLPILLASVVQGYSAFSARWRSLTVELVLLFWSGGIFLLTKSRISLISLLALAICAYFAIGLGKVWRYWQKWRPARHRALKVSLSYFGVVIGLVACAAALAALALFAMSKVDRRMGDLTSIPAQIEADRYFYPGEAVFAVSDRLAFAERMVYWTVALRTFSEYPIFGVGLGNTGFFFQSNLPAYGYQLTEIHNIFVQRAYGFPNPKNIWLRTLAETGLLGFSSYVTWYLLVACAALILWRRGVGVGRVLGLAGMLVFVTQLVEGFSIDSYALPQVWITLGVVTAASADLLPAGIRSRLGGGRSGNAA